MKYKISIFGLGYVGTVLLGCLAREGHTVIGVDIDEAKLDLLRNGKTPVLEKDMASLIAAAHASGRLEVTDDTEYAIKCSEITFICVGTPSMSNGDQNQSAILRVVEGIGRVLKHLNRYHVLVIRSTVLPGTVENQIRPILEKYSDKTEGNDFGLCFQPEFLREGSSIEDYYNPPFTVVGTNSETAMSLVLDIFQHLPCEFIRTSIGTAEMIKYSCNIFHALKITFANEIGRFCQALKIDSRDVMEIFCKDRQLNISRAYMKPGFAFGGSCLPKDLKALLYCAKMNDVSMPMLSNILQSNMVHIEHAVNIVLSTGIKSVGMIGLSFKGGTDDLRESPLVAMAERFIGKGLNLTIYDPHVNLSRLIGANRRYIEHTIPHIASLMSDICEKLINDCIVLIIGQNDKGFLEKLYSLGRKDHFILDLVGCVDQRKIPGTYMGLCW